MVLGLNGRMPLNTAGNLNARVAADDPTSDINAPCFNEAGMPLFDHASHLGYSPSEINPTYALQNGYIGSSGSALDSPGNPDNSQYSSQFDNASIPVNVTPQYSGIPVSLTQLRSLLAGTRLPDPATFTSNTPGEKNYVPTGTGSVSSPSSTNVPISNNVADVGYYTSTADDNSDLMNNSGYIPRPGDAVAGRWGEPGAIPYGYSPYNDANVGGAFVANDALIGPAIRQALNYESIQTTYYSNTLVSNNPAYSGLAITLPVPAQAGVSPHSQSSTTSTGSTTITTATTSTRSGPRRPTGTPR